MVSSENVAHLQLCSLALGLIQLESIAAEFPELLCGDERALVYRIPRLGVKSISFDFSSCVFPMDFQNVRCEFKLLMCSKSEFYQTLTYDEAQMYAQPHCGSATLCALMGDVPGMMFN